MDLPEDLPQLYRRHIFACGTQRPPMHPRGSCGQSGAQPLWERLGQKIEAAGLSGEVGFTISGCLGFCSAGPLMVIYPEGVWYRPQSEADVDHIFARHIQQDAVAEDHVVVLSR